MKAFEDYIHQIENWAGEEDWRLRAAIGSALRDLDRRIPKMAEVTAAIEKALGPGLDEVEARIAALEAPTSDLSDGDAGRKGFAEIAKDLISRGAGLAFALRIIHGQGLRAVDLAHYEALQEEQTTD